MEGKQENVEHSLLLDLIREGGSRAEPVAVTEAGALFRDLGCTVIAAAPGEVRLGFRCGAAHVQGNGVVNGGIVATMLDLGLAWAALTRLPAERSAATIALNVAFLRPALPGAFTVAGRTVAFGYRTAQSEAQLFDAEGRLIATATSPLALRGGGGG